MPLDLLVDLAVDVDDLAPVGDRRLDEQLEFVGPEERTLGEVTRRVLRAPTVEAFD